MCTTPTMTITPEYFDKHMSIATGITVSGSSFGTLIMGPLSQFIIDKAGWRTAFRVYAGLIVITILLNSRIRAPPTVTKRKLEGRSFIKDLEIWKNRVFVVWTIAITLVMFGFYIPYVHLVNIFSYLMTVLNTCTLLYTYT
jgi:MCP family monocarboxylic acid transporter-like MFS transporter 10